MWRFALLFVPVLLSANMKTVLMAKEHHPLTVVRLYAGSDGMSHFEPINLSFVAIAGMPQGVERSGEMVTAQSYIVRAAPGYFYDWHNADARRYVITVSGRAEIEVAGGKKLLLQPGEIVLAEDLTGKGHTFRVLGDQEWIAMFVDLRK